MHFIVKDCKKSLGSSELVDESAFETPPHAVVQRSVVANSTHKRADRRQGSGGTLQIEPQRVSGTTGQPTKRNSGARIARREQHRRVGHSNLNVVAPIGMRVPHDWMGVTRAGSDDPSRGAMASRMARRAETSVQSLLDQVRGLLVAEASYGMPRPERSGVRGSLRTVLVNWQLRLASEYYLFRDTFHLAVQLMERTLEKVCLPID